jgi:Arc/MetJ-type ribon-helix-helix transcriptional regulator
MVANCWQYGYIFPMKMQTMNISLTPDLADYVRKITMEQYGNASEFFREMLRERIRRQAEQDVAFLQSTAAGAPDGPNEAELREVLAVQRAVRKELKRERGV